MNLLMRLLLGTAMTSGFGEQFPGNNMGDFRALLDAYEPGKKSPKEAPIDRITAAFDTLKNMHQDRGVGIGGAVQASPLDTAQWPFGPVGAPSQAQAQAQAAPAAPATPQAPVPMPQPRPAEAPAPDSPALSGFFARNTAMMRDPATGDFIDPQAAAAAGPGILQGLFG